MSFSVAEEERCNLERYRFPRRDEEGHDRPESLERQGLKSSISRHRQLDVESLGGQTPENNSLYQELSKYKMVFVPNHCHQRHQHREPQKSILRRSNVKERESLSPLRQRYGQPPAADSDYVYHSPRETIRNFNEQMERNSNGRYGSLVEFANDNKLDVEGKVFASCEEPKIDLEQGLEEADRKSVV